jgi:hypothetical protein
VDHRQPDEGRLARVIDVELLARSGHLSESGIDD